MWMQPPKAGPARTSWGPPGCPPTRPNRTPSQSQTTARTPAPPRVRNTLSFHKGLPFSTEPNSHENHSPFCKRVCVSCHICSLSHSVTAFHSQLHICKRKSLLSRVSLSILGTKKTLLDRGRWRELESQPSKSKSFIIFYYISSSLLRSSINYAPKLSFALFASLNQQISLMSYSFFLICCFFYPCWFPLRSGVASGGSS